MRQMRFLAGIAVILVLLLLVLDWNALTAAQEATDQTFADLLSELWSQVLAAQTSESSSNFVFTVEFQESISGLGNSVTLGQGLNTLRLERINADHFCISRVFSRSLNVDCIPYTNINKVSFREDQS